MNRFRRIRALLWLSIPLLFVGGVGWWTYARVRQERLNRALIAAVKQGSEGEVKSLLEHGADPNVREHADTKPTDIRDLLTSLFQPQTAQTPNESKTALMLAADRADTEMVRDLLDHKADVNARDDEGCTPLFYAIATRNEKTISLLLKS